MSEHNFNTLIAIPCLTTGRRLYALKKCLEVASALDDETLQSLIVEAIAHDSETISMERSWTRSRNLSTARGKSFEIDHQIGGLMGTFHSALSGHLFAFQPEDPICIASKRIIDQIFPEGVRPVVTLPFEEQLAVNDDIIFQLREDLAEMVADAGVASYVERLVPLNEAFRSELDNSKSKEIDFNRLDVAKTKGIFFVRRIAAIILGTYWEETPEAVEAQRALLAPILEQCERVRQARKGRRAPRDIDPQTGEEIDDATGDKTEAA